MKKVAILQSNYIPWKGYFDLIAAVDEFILYDEMQYTRRDWRNRNKIKTPRGLQWLTVPVRTKNRYLQKICETEIDGTDWQKNHWTQICSNYRKAPFFGEISSIMETLYLRREYRVISDLNETFIREICAYLGIETKITHSWDYQLEGDKTERLASLCAQAGGDEYISGPAAKYYIDCNVFSQNGIKLSWFEYGSYSEYSQLWGKFEHGVSILDLLINCGKSSRNFMQLI